MPLTRPATIAKQHGITRQSVINWTTKGRGHGSKREVLASQAIDGVVFIDSDDVDSFLQRTASVDRSVEPLLNDLFDFLHRMENHPFSNDERIALMNRLALQNTGE